MTRGKGKSERRKARQPEAAIRGEKTPVAVASISLQSRSGKQGKLQRTQRQWCRNFRIDKPCNKITEITDVNRKCFSWLIFWCQSHSTGSVPRYAQALIPVIRATVITARASFHFIPPLSLSLSSA